MTRPISTESTGERSPSSTPLWGLAIMIVVLGVFGRTLGHDVLRYDDRFHLHDNPSLTQPDATGVVRGIGELWTRSYGNLYAPVSYTLFGLQMIAADRGTEGDPASRYDPRVFRAVSVALHAMVSVLVFVLLRRVLPSAPAWACAVAALVFAVHPVQVEAVAWISEQRGLLAAGFAFGAVTVWSRTPRGRARVAIASCLFLIGLLAKPSVAGLAAAPVLIALLRHEPIRRALAVSAAWAILAAGVLVLTRILQDAGSVRHAAPVWARPLVAFDCAAWAFRSVVFPVGLSPDRARPPDEVVAGLWTQSVAWGLALVALTSVAAWRWRSKQDRRWLIGLAWAAIAMAPVLGLVTFHHQEISTIADRYLYPAMVGISLTLGASLSRIPRRAGLGLGLGMCLVLASVSFVQAGHWRDDTALWRHTIGVSPESPVAHNNLGFELASRGEHEQAAEMYARAIELDPDLERVHANLGVSLRAIGRTRDAEATLRTHVERTPGDARALTILGTLAAERGAFDDARAWFERSLKVDPRDAEAMNNLGLLAARGGEPLPAIGWYERALEIRPWFPEAWTNYAISLRAIGDAGRAEAALLRATAQDPGLFQAWSQLGVLRLGAQDWSGAEAALVRASELGPLDATVWNNLGLTLVQQGRLADAERAFADAMRLDPALQAARDNLAGVRTLIRREREPSGGG